MQKEKYKPIEFRGKVVEINPVYSNLEYKGARIKMVRELWDKDNNIEAYFYGNIPVLFCHRGARFSQSIKTKSDGIYLEQILKTDVESTVYRITATKRIESKNSV